VLLGAVQGLAEGLLRPAALLSDSFRQRDVLAESGHRPWPLPRRPWLMGQVWIDLLFAHWRVPAEALERVVPPQLPLDTYEGDHWLGITPFRVEGLRLRGTAPAPVLSSFPEINVRAYVNVDGRPGIHFLSLDADSWAAVFAARRGYRLPYFRSQIAMAAEASGVSFASRRVSGDGPAAAFRARYGPRGELLPRRPGSLERWLAERYCLYTLDERGRVLRGDIHHPPWPLQPAWAEIDHNTMTSGHRIPLEGEPLLHYSRRQDVALWSVEPATA
jgi:uncharacterized protein YqjF (DUF2071 family)